MEAISIILAFSGIMWYLIDRAKPLWAEVAWGKWVTIGVAAAAGFALAFGFNLDLIYTLGMTASASVGGTIITGFALMAGSSAVSEIIEKIQK